MEFKGALFVVKDVKVSRDFYENVLNQKVKYDFGENVTFEGDFSIQEINSFAKMTSLDSGSIGVKTHNSELYFETKDLDAIIKKLDDCKREIEFVQKIIKHPWGQRVTRFYDPDQHIIEIGENMEVVILRFLSMGYSVKETAKLTQYPEGYVKSVEIVNQEI